MPYKDKQQAREAAHVRYLRRKERLRLTYHGPGRGHHGHNLRGAQHYRWNQGKLRDQHGYILIRVGRTHAFADPNGYVHEHILVMFAATGKRLETGQIVHHLNYDKGDNRLDNLQVMTCGEHNALHNKIDRTRGTDGRFYPKRAGRLLDGKLHSDLCWEAKS